MQVDDHVRNHLGDILIRVRLGVQPIEQLAEEQRGIELAATLHMLVEVSLESVHVAAQFGYELKPASVQALTPAPLKMPTTLPQTRTSLVGHVDQNVLPAQEAMLSRSLL